MVAEVLQAGVLDGDGTQAVQVVVHADSGGLGPGDVHIVQSEGPGSAGVGHSDLNLGDAGRHVNGSQSHLEAGVGSAEIETIGGGVVQSDPLALGGLTAVDSQVVAPTVQSDAAHLDSGGNLTLVLVDQVALATGQGVGVTHSHALAHLGMVAEVLQTGSLGGNGQVIQGIIGVLGQCGGRNLHGLIGNLTDLLTQVTLGIVLVVVLVRASLQVVVGSLGLAPAVQITDQSDQILVVQLAVRVEVGGDSVDLNIPAVQGALQIGSILQVDGAVVVDVAVQGLNDQLLGPDADAVHDGSPVDTGDLIAVLVDGLAEHIQLNLNVVVLTGHVAGQSRLTPVVGVDVVHGIADGSGHVDPVLAILGYVNGEVLSKVILVVHGRAQGIQLNAADGVGQLVDHGVVGSVVLLGHQSALDLSVVLPLQTIVSVAGMNLGEVVESVLEQGQTDVGIAVLDGQLIQSLVDLQNDLCGLLIGQILGGQNGVQSGDGLGHGSGVGLVQVDQVLQSQLLLIHSVVGVIVQVVVVSIRGTGGIHSLGVHTSQGDVALIGVSGVTGGVDVSADGQEVHSGVVLNGTHGLLLANQLAVQIQAGLLAVEGVGDVVPGIQSQLGSGNVDVAALALGVLDVGTDLEHTVSGVLYGDTAGLGVAEQALTGRDGLSGSLESHLNGEALGQILEVALRNGVVDPALHRSDLAAQLLIIVQLDGVRTHVQAVLTAIGGSILEADSGVDIQEVGTVVGNAGGRDRLGGELGGDRLAGLTVGLDGGDVDDALGVGGQAFQIQLVLGLLSAQLVEVGDEVLAHQSLAGRVGHGDVVRVHVIVVRGGGELNVNGVAGHVAHSDGGVGSKLGGHTLVRTGGGVDEVLLGQGQVQRPGILDLDGLVRVVAIVLVIRLHTLDIQGLGVAVDLQDQIVLIGVAGSSGADTGLGEDVVGLSRGVLHRGNVDAGEILLHNGLLVGEIEVRVAGQIDDLGIITQHLVQRTGGRGAPVGTVGGVGQGLVAHHDDGGIGIGSGGLGQLLLQVHHRIQRVGAVNQMALGVQTDDVDAVHDLVEVGFLFAEGVQIGLHDLIVGLATEIHALELVVTGDGQHLNVGITHNLGPNVVELLILLGNAGVDQVTGEQNGGNALVLQVGQSGLQSVVTGGRTGLQMDIGHNADLLALILGQRGIQLGGGVLVGVSGQNVGRHGNLDGLDGQLDTGGEQTDGAGLTQVSGIPLSGIHVHLITLQGRIVLQVVGLPPGAAVAGAHIAAELGLLKGLVGVQGVLRAGVGDLPGHVVTLGLPVGVNGLGGGVPGAGLGALGGAVAGPVRTAPGTGGTDGEGQSGIGLVGCIIDAGQRGQTHTVAAGGGTADEDAIAVQGVGLIGLGTVTTGDDTAGTHVVVDPSLRHIHGDLVVAEGIQELGQPYVVVSGVVTVTDVQLAIDDLSVVDVVGVVGLYGLVSNHVGVLELGPALGQGAVGNRLEVFLVQNVLGLVSVLGDDGDGAVVAIGILNVQNVHTLGRGDQDAAADGNLGVAAGPDHIVTGHGNAVEGHGNVAQLDLLIHVDKQIAVVLGNGEVLTLCVGDDGAQRQHGQQHQYRQQDGQITLHKKSPPKIKIFGKISIT